MTGRQAALWSIPAIGAALGVLGIVHAMGPDREAIRAQLAAELMKLEALPADDVVRRDRRVEELMAVEDYQTHARALWLKLERMHGPLHQEARLDEEARKKALPFLARTADVSKLSVAELAAALDEGRALMDNFARTRYGPALRERKEQLAEALRKQEEAKRGPNVLTVVATAEKLRLEGHYAAALVLIDDALRASVKDPGSRSTLEEERERILKSSKQKGDKLLAQAAADRDPAPLEKALPDFKGLAEAGRIEAMIRQLRGR